MRSAPPRPLAAVAAVALLAAAAAAVPLTPPAAAAAPACGTTSDPMVVERSYPAGADRRYDYVAFDVPAGTTRIEVGYSWVDHAEARGLPANPLTQTTFDLGLWEATIDHDSGFRGWSGSRLGNVGRGQAPVRVATDSASRGYLPGPIAPGPWFAEVGVAALGPEGATAHVEIACSADPTGPPPAPDPVDDGFVAVRDGQPVGRGWYHADFHLHGRHSHPCAPEWTGPDVNACGHPSVVTQARAAGLDVLPITDYVTTAHWDELGAVQRANPDLLVWPGREIITYFGHATTFGATGVAEYRHGADTDGDGAADVTLGDVQARIKDAGGLFGVAHPTIFPGPAFRNFCRGCEFELTGDLDWDRVDTVEVVTGPALADLSDAHGSFPSTHSRGLSAEQPFVPTAIDFWEDLLLRGHKVAPVSGSDSKGVDGADQRDRKGYGSSATAILADELSVAGLEEAIAAGRVYVRTLGVDASPELDLTVTSLDGSQSGTFGAVLAAEAATMVVTVRGGAGQVVEVSRNGRPAAAIPLSGDDVTLTVPIARVTAEETPGNPLGTFWRVDVRDERVHTAIGNAVFLTG